MLKIDFSKLYPHENTDYRAIAFIIESLPFLGNQYDSRDDGVLGSLTGLKWGLTPPNILTDSFTTHSEWLSQENIKKVFLDELPPSLFCKCHGDTDPKTVDLKKLDYFRGWLDWIEVLARWEESLIKLREPLWEADGKLKLDVVQSGSHVTEVDGKFERKPDFLPNWSSSTPSYSIYRDAAFDNTSRFWDEVRARHAQFLGSQRKIAEYEWVDQTSEVYSLGGCFYHVTTSDGLIRVIEPDDDIVSIFFNSESDCVLYPNQKSCSVNHDCYDENLEHPRATLTLL